MKNYLDIPPRTTSNDPLDEIGIILRTLVVQAQDEARTNVENKAMIPAAKAKLAVHYQAKLAEAERLAKLSELEFLKDIAEENRYDYDSMIGDRIELLSNKRGVGNE